MVLFHLSDRYQPLQWLENVDEARQIFLHPDVTDAFDIAPAEPDLDGIVRFLCEEREFSRERVSAAIERAFRERTLF